MTEIDNLSSLPLFAPRAGEQRSRLETAFWQFHHAHPLVFTTLLRLAREWKADGHGRIGIKTLYERARWEFGVGSAGARYALNNNHTAYYSRLLMTQHPDLRGIFATRSQKRKASIA